LALYTYSGLNLSSVPAFCFKSVIVSSLLHVSVGGLTIVEVKSLDVDDVISVWKEKS
jgi:hypothetical protein